MIAVITSTLIPSSNSFSYFNNRERYQQTVETIKNLSTIGFKSIYLFDNSPQKIDCEQLIRDTSPNLIIIHSFQYNFKNKGLNEILLLLNNIHCLPKDVGIFKISARYLTTKEFDYKNINFSNYVIAGKGYGFKKKDGTFSTRAYFAKNKYILEQLLVHCMEDILSYSNRIHGLRSGIAAITEYLKPSILLKYQISIEYAFARIIKQHYSHLILNNINIEGYIAGGKKLEKIVE